MEEKKTIIDNFAEFVSGLGVESIPERIIEKIKLQIITSITAAKFSSWHPEASKIFEAENKKPQGKKASTVIALNKKLGPESAAVVNAAFGMSLDFDDYMLMGHTGYSSVLTPLAFLEDNNGTLAELIIAAVGSNEIMGRLSLSCFFGPLNGQMWSYIHNLGAAAAVAKVKKFDIETTANAMSIALYQPNFCLVPGFWQEGCKLLTAATPLRNGIQAALYAESGLAGARNIIEAPLGFLHFFAFFPMEEFVADLGKAWLSDTLSYKRYPGTSYIGGPVDAALSALNGFGFGPGTEEIENIIIDTFFLSHGIELISAAQCKKDLDAVAINFSVRYSVAYALLRGDLKPEFFREDEIKKYQNAIFDLAKKIKVRHNWSMTARTLQTFPDLIRILRKRKLNEIFRLIEHTRAMRLNSLPWTIDTLTGFYEFFSFALRKENLKKFFERDEMPIGLLNVDLINYPMLQSAKTKIVLSNGKSSSAECSILTGGSGNGFDAQKEWVARRYELSFHKDSNIVFRLMNDLNIPVRVLMKELMSDRAK